MTLAPLGDRLGGDPKLSVQLRDRSVRLLYLSPDGVRDRGAAMTNLFHSAPFHSCERITPSTPGSEQLENYDLPGDLRQKIDAFVEQYNHRRYHESLQNLTPADVCFGRGRTILKKRESIRRPSKPGTCVTVNPPHKHTNQMRQPLS